MSSALFYPPSQKALSGRAGMSAKSVSAIALSGVKGGRRSCCGGFRRTCEDALHGSAVSFTFDVIIPSDSIPVYLYPCNASTLHKQPLFQILAYKKTLKLPAEGMVSSGFGKRGYSSEVYGKGLCE